MNGSVIKVTLLSSILMASGCASIEEKRAFYELQARALEREQPLFRLEAQEGQDITGLKSLEVFLPTQRRLEQFVDPSYQMATQIASIAVPLLGTFIMSRENRLMVENINRGYSALNARTMESIDHSIGMTGEVALGGLSGLEAVSGAHLRHLTEQSQLHTDQIGQAFFQLGTIALSGFEALTPPIPDPIIITD